jgi:hypothetical protein
MARLMKPDEKRARELLLGFCAGEELFLGAAPRALRP